MHLFEAIEDNVLFYFSDCHEIGSSDVSICVNSIIEDAGLTDVSDDFRRQIRMMTNNAISNLLD